MSCHGTLLVGILERIVEEGRIAHYGVKLAVCVGCEILYRAFDDADTVGKRSAAHVVVCLHGSFMVDVYARNGSFAISLSHHECNQA